MQKSLLQQLIAVFFLAVFCLFNPSQAQEIPFYQIKALAQASFHPLFTNTQSLPSLAPRISNDGTIIYNDFSGGYIYRRCERPIPLFIDSKRYFVHDINDSQNLLISYQTPCGSQEYYLCDSDHWKRFSKSALFLVGAKNLYFNKLTNTCAAIGYMVINGQKRGAYYTDKKGLISLPCFELFASGREGALVGVRDKTLFYYKIWREILCMDEWSSLNPHFCEFFASALLDERGRALIELKRRSQSRFFLWNAEERTLCPLPFQGFKPQLFNYNNLVVGKKNGKIGIATFSKKPLELEKLIIENQKKPKSLKWRVLQITDMNYQGELVGVAIYRHKPYLVLLSPCLPSKQ